MSKAFTKEDDSEVELDDELPDLPGGVTNYMTVEGLQRLRDEFRVFAAG
ncbi:MAG: hypothetical protein WDN29_01965 [Methylovirgula sp.]